MGTHPDVLVIGGGIIGLTSAYFLAKAGLSVEVIDKGEMGKEASWAGAGIIPPGEFPHLTTTPIDHLRAYSSFRFLRFSDELAAETGIDNEFDFCGGVEFLPTDDLDVTDLWRAEWIRFERFGGRLSDLVPGVDTPPGTVPHHLPRMGQVRNPRHLAALLAACRGRGMQLSPGVPFGWWQTSGRRVTAVTAEGEPKTAKQYLITTGAWSDELLGQLGWHPHIHPVRGQIVLFNPGRRLFTHVLMHGKRYLVPREDGRVLVGSTEEPEAGFDKSNTPEGVQGLIDFACSIVPELRNAPVEKTWAGLRPGTPDGLPYIGRVPGWDNVFVAAGHFRAGVQLSIGTAEVVRDLILSREPPVPIDAFRLDRVPDATARPAFRS